MTYQQTLEFLFEQLPMYQRQGKSAYKKDLTNTVRLLDLLDNPHQKIKTVHIAGTNGKGTSAHAIAATLQMAGYRTGLYTSPHLKSFTERIRVNGVEVAEDFVINFVSQIRQSIFEIKPSFFEITVAMAFHYFQEEKVDIAVIETGLGGRLDSTNVITPEVCLITSIGYDHMDMLGDTLEKIAGEKAGIIKNKVPVVINEGTKETLPVFEAKALEMDSQLIIPEQVEWIPSGLVPSYMVKNLPGIVAVIEQLRQMGWKISDTDLRTGVSEVNILTGLKGRLQVLEKEPLIIADVSHNAEGLQVLFDQILEICKGDLYLIFGTVKDKELGGIFQTIPLAAKIFWTQSTVPRALAAVELKAAANDFGLEGTVVPSVNDAMKRARQAMKTEDLLLITGSTFVVAEIDDL